MKYFHVLVASNTYRKNEPLTYCFGESIAVGSIVKVPLQKKVVLGIIAKGVGKPSFEVRPIKELVSTRGLPPQLIKLIDWLSEYYPANLGSLLLSCLPSSLITKAKISHKVVDKKTTQKYHALPSLTKEQSNAVSEVIMNRSLSNLIHGETGSGKTRIYLELAQKCIENRRSVLILTPEIGLTTQLAQSFRAVFQEKVITFHSQLTTQQRREAWLRIIANSSPCIVVGTRSALFTPIYNIGLIVMDEAHEQAYKQEQAPHYQTSRVAATLAKLHKAYFLMGTATPLVTDYYYFKQKDLPVIRLSESAIKTATPPKIKVIDLQQREEFTRSAFISETLRKSVDQALRAHEQSLIFLNRRGSARIMLCRKCGWQAVCPHCDLSLTFHSDYHEMRCHICGYKSAVTLACPSCSNPDVTFHSPGTKTVVSELERLFPEARIGRFDTDNKKNERLENTYNEIRGGRLDILVGTQVLVKGLDLPMLSVVGAIQADTGLLIPDYTADEITYQQLVQIIGRVGRGHREGKVIIQTYNPENSVIRAAIDRDYKAFYDAQLKQRQQFKFPPFVYVLKLIIHKARPSSSKAAAINLRRNIEALRLPIEINGPGPAFHEKRSGQYYWQLIIKAKTRTQLLTIIRNLPSGWSYDIDPISLL